MAAPDMLSRLKFRSFDLIDCPVWVCDAVKLALMDANAAAADWLWDDTQADSERALAELISPQDRKRALAVIERVAGLCPRWWCRRRPRAEPLA